jgi:hypothetical protein
LADFLVHAQSGFVADSDRMQIQFPVQLVELASPVRFSQPWFKEYEPARESKTNIGK